MHMEVKLPSGAVAEIREKLTAKDKFKVQGAIKFSLDTTTGLQETDGSIGLGMINALLTQVIESWTVDGLSIPSQDPEALEKLDIDDYNALVEATDPLMTKITAGSVPNRRRQPSS